MIALARSISHAAKTIKSSDQSFLKDFIRTKIRNMQKQRDRVVPPHNTPFADNELWEQLVLRKRKHTTNVCEFTLGGIGWAFMTFYVDSD